MKKHYEKMCMTPLGFEPLGALLNGSVVTTTSSVSTTGQVVEEIDFSSSTSGFSGNAWE